MSGYDEGLDPDAKEFNERFSAIPSDVAEIMQKLASDDHPIVRDLTNAELLKIIVQQSSLSTDLLACLVSFRLHDPKDLDARLMKARDKVFDIMRGLSGTLEQRGG